jgi:hypothetical protein
MRAGGFRSRHLAEGALGISLGLPPPTNLDHNEELSQLAQIQQLPCQALRGPASYRAVHCNALARQRASLRG